MALTTSEAVQAYAFRELVRHLQMRTDVQNIDQMNLAGYCRNCLSKWLYAGALKTSNGDHPSYNDCLADVYGMSYGQWKTKYQKKATPEQMALYKETKALQAKHSPAVEAAAKAAKKSLKKPETKSTTKIVQQVAASGLSNVCCTPAEEVASKAMTASATKPLGAEVMNDADPVEVKLPPGTTIRAAIIVVSDRVTAGVYKDESGPAIEKSLKEFEAKLGCSFPVTAVKVVPDEKKIISDAIRTLADDVKAPPSLILTTGGTGFSARDVTPEATKEASDRLVPGLATHVTIQSSRKEPFALLSRAVSGIRKKSLVFNLPGRPKAVRENLAIALPVLSHAAIQLESS